MILSLLLLLDVARADSICPIIVGGSEVLPDDKYDYYATYAVNVWRDGSEVVSIIGCSTSNGESDSIESAKQDAYKKLNEAFQDLKIEVTSSNCQERKHRAYRSNYTDINITGVAAICNVTEWISTAPPVPDSQVVDNSDLVMVVRVTNGQSIYVNMGSDVVEIGKINTTLSSRREVITLDNPEVYLPISKYNYSIVKIKLLKYDSYLNEYNEGLIIVTNNPPYYDNPLPESYQVTMTSNKAPLEEHNEMSKKRYNAGALAISIPLILGGGVCGGIALINKEKRDHAAEAYDALTGIEHDWFLTEETKKQQNVLLISAAMLGTTGLAIMIAGAF